MEIHLQALIPWSQQIKENPMVLQTNKNGGFMTLPGPDSTVHRTRLLIDEGFDGIAARIVDAKDNISSKVILLNNKNPVFVNLKTAPLKVIQANGVIWALDNKGLSSYNTEGKLLKTINVEADDFWLRKNTFWFHSIKKGTIQYMKDSVWSEPLERKSLSHMIMGENGNLYTIKNNSDATLEEYSVNNGITKLKKDFLESFDEILFVSKKTDKIVFKRSNHIITYLKNELVHTFSLVNAGLDENKKPFLSGRKDESILLVQQDAQALSIPLPKEIQGNLYGNISAKAINQNEVLIYSLDYAAFFNKQTKEIRNIDLNKQSYDKNIFPNEWLLSDLVVDPSDASRIILVSSGKEGLAIINLEMN